MEKINSGGYFSKNHNNFLNIALTFSFFETQNISKRLNIKSEINGNHTENFQH